MSPAKQAEVGNIAAARRVADVMHRGVISCSPDTPALKAAMIMAAHRVHAVVVTAPATLPRLVTDTEVASALYSETLWMIRVDEIATSAPLVGLDDSLAYALARMHESASTHAVAVDRAYKPLGVISVIDLVEALE